MEKDTEVTKETTAKEEIEIARRAIARQISIRLKRARKPEELVNLAVILEKITIWE